MSAPSMGFLVQIAHKHGTDPTVCRSNEEATEVVAQFCRDWWSYEGIAVKLGVTAAEYEEQHGREAMINAYFEQSEDEGAEITEVELPS